MGGTYYKNLISKVMEKWDLFQYDKNGFKDTLDIGQERKRLIS